MSNIIENIKKNALDIIQTEFEIISKLPSVVDNNFAKIISIFVNMKGKIILSGAGKSALIAQKIAATMNSTGIKAVFLHATDALHGDMGIIDKEDIMLYVSKSGNTPEIKRLFYFVKDMVKMSISIVSNEDSYLAKQSDYHIYVPVSREACNNNLIPTSSTTAHLIVGDAIALTIAKMRGFTVEDFKRFHPGGILGKRLYMKVEDIFDKNNIPSVGVNDLIKDVIINISSCRLGATVVQDEEGNLVGIITDGDVRRMVERGGNMSTLQAKDIMSRNPKTIDISSLAVEAFNMMKVNKITSIVVLSGGKYAGLIHIHDIIREGIC